MQSNHIISVAFLHILAQQTQYAMSYMARVIKFWPKPFGTHRIIVIVFDVDALPNVSLKELKAEDIASLKFI